MVIRNYTLFALVSLFICGFSNAQISQSCDCTVDTAGLANYLNTLNLNENQPLTFEVENSSSTFAVLHGYIDASTPGVVNNFISNYPNVTTLVFMQVPGSEDDNSNLIASQALRNQGYKHYIPAVTAYADDAFIASGGVDMFVGGLTRVVDVNAEVGVHSWSDGVNEATDFPVGHPNHMPYINYYVNMGFTQQEAEDFYYFTINAAPASNIHVMTENELNLYKIRTCTYSATPSYSISHSSGVLTADLAGAAYQWLDCNNGNAPISGETSQSFTASSNGSYAVQITENACAGTSNCFVIDALGILESEGSNLSLYPNPSKKTVLIEGISEISNAELVNGQGQVLKRWSDSTIIDVSELDCGVYWIRVQSNDETTVLQFVKE